MKKITVKVEKTETGFSAFAENYPAFTTGRNSAELVSNMVESLNLYFEEEGINRTVDARHLSFEIQISTVFDVFPINVKALSERIDMNYTLLSQYATGKKKPSGKQLEKIKSGIVEIGRELTSISLLF